MRVDKWLVARPGPQPCYVFLLQYEGSCWPGVGGGRVSQPLMSRSYGSPVLKRKVPTVKQRFTSSKPPRPIPGPFVTESYNAATIDIENLHAIPSRQDREITAVSTAPAGRAPTFTKIA